MLGEVFCSKCAVLLNNSMSMKDSQVMTNVDVWRQTPIKVNSEKYRNTIGIVATLFAPATTPKEGGGGRNRNAIRDVKNFGFFSPRGFKNTNITFKLGLAIVCMVLCHICSVSVCSAILFLV